MTDDARSNADIRADTPFDVRGPTDAELAEIAEDVERLERALGHLAISFGNLEDDYRWLLGHLLGSARKGLVVGSRLGFVDLVAVCERLGQAVQLNGVDDAVRVARAAVELRNPMIHAAWWPSRTSLPLIVGESPRQAGTAERVRVPRRGAQAVRTTMNIADVEAAAEACEEARRLLWRAGEAFADDIDAIASLSEPEQ